MSLTINPTTSTTIAGSSATGEVAPVASTGATSGAAAGLAPSFVALAFAQIDTGPLGLSKPTGAEDLAAMLSEVEMNLDATSSQTRSNSLANGLEGRRAGILGGAALIAQQQQDEAALGTAQATLTADQASLTAKQSDQSTAATQSAQDGSTIAGLGAQVAVLTAQIDAAQAANPNADVSTLTSQRDALNGQIATAQADKATADATVASDAADIDTLTETVATDAATVGEAASTLAYDQAFRTPLILAAFTRLAHTLQTGDGQFQRNTTTSGNLDLGFRSLDQAQSGFRADETQRTRSANADVDAVLKQGDDRRGDLRQVAAAVAAGLADVQAVLAQLKQQSVPAADSAPAGRVRLSL